MADEQPSQEGASHVPRLAKQHQKLQGGRQNATLWQLITFGWAGGMVQEANKRALQEDDAESMMPDRDAAGKLAQEFDAAYERIKVMHAGARCP